MIDAEFPSDPYVEVREVFYDTLGKPLGHTTATISGDSKDEVATYLQWALEALNKPILKFKD
jgi:hypothetical protein